MQFIKYRVNITLFENIGKIKTPNQNPGWGLTKRTSAYEQKQSQLRNMGKNNFDFSET